MLSYSHRFPFVEVVVGRILVADLGDSLVEEDLVGNLVVEDLVGNILVEVGPVVGIEVLVGNNLYYYHLLALVVEQLDESTGQNIQQVQYKKTTKNQMDFYGRHFLKSISFNFLIM